MTDASLDQLHADVAAYAKSHRGRMYAPIRHPAFDDIPYQHGPERWTLIEENIPDGARTALDIGSHWGYFAHCLEDYGLETTAAEKSRSYLDFLDRIRELCGKRFKTYRGSVFDMPDPLSFDVVVAFNIFHHFIKEESTFKEFVGFLNRLECQVMFFQAHNPTEGQMSRAFRNFEPHEFAEFVKREAGLSQVREIGRVGQRPVFAISSS
jgi:2-polyprenyl-3-methyl-5-hydroxy-6-metoxy-1,4-benzoquinol methylase